MGMLDELKRMSKAVLGGEDSTDAPDTESPVTDSVVTDAPTTMIPDDFETEVPTTEIFKTDAPSTNSVSTNAPTTDQPEDESTRLKAEIELLRNEIKDLKEPKPTEAPSTDAPIDEHNFMDGVDIDTVVSDPEEFNKLLNNVYKQGVLFARNEIKHGSEDVFKRLPDAISSNVNVIEELKAISNKFYEDNSDLVKYQSNVSAAFGEVAAENPDKTYEEVLNLTADKVRSSLNLTKPEVKTTKDKKPPRLPKNRGGGRPTKTKTQGVEAEIAAMNEALQS